MPKSAAAQRARSIVRKVLGQHEIATLQTTIIDQDIQTVSLTPVLVSKHGRAISGRKWAGLITGSKGGVVCALA
jgi:hypothetical protein